jgi:aryl-alcohol dehydrogenase-like predicted oxidoreductase
MEKEAQNDKSVMRRVGRTEMFVPKLILGGMARRESTDQERISLFAAAIDSGFTTIDTAPLYGFGRGEKQLGEALKHFRHRELQVLTKVGLRWDGDKHGDVLFKFTDDRGRLRQVRKDSRPESIRWEVSQSLQRLGLESLDLVQIHHPDRHIPIAESIGALLDLRKEGKLRHIGVSNFSSEQVRAAQEALGDVPLCCVQPEYSLLRRAAETALLPVCRELNVGVIVYSPLAEGILAGQLHKKPLLDNENIKQVIREVLQPIARSHNVSDAAVALSWVGSQAGITAAITGVSTVKQLEEQAQAFSLDLPDSELEQLSSAFSEVQLPYSWEVPRSGPGSVVRGVRSFLGRAARRMGIDPKSLRRGS